MFSYIDLESRIPQSHPIRKVRQVVDAALSEIEGQFDAMYAAGGRPSIPPEMLIRASLLQILFTIRSERQLCERIDYDLMFRWFVGLGMDDPVWNHSTFSKNRDRLMASQVDELLFEAVKKQAYARKLLSRDHFTVDGTLLEASASLKSFKPKDRRDDDPPSGGSNQAVNFHGEKRSNKTHQSTTDGDSRLFRKGPGKEARLTYMGHLLTENRNGFIVEAEVTQSGGRQEWDAGLSMLSKQSTRPGQTIGADKGYDTGDFVRGCREFGLTPHVAAKKAQSAVDRRTTGTAGYEVSQRKRKQVEECFGWMKTFGLMHKLKVRGTPNVSWMFRLAATAYNITRLKAFA
jgi:transposase